MALTRTQIINNLLAMMAANSVSTDSAASQLAFAEEIADSILGAEPSEFMFVSSKSDLPTPSAGVITLENNVTYYFIDHVDLTGDRLVSGENTTILGASSENCSITSTGLGIGVPLLTTVWTMPFRHITIKDVDTALYIDGSINPPVALDWTGVNFQNVPNVGTISTCSNFIFSKGAFLNSQGLIFDGTIGTVGVDNSLFLGDGASGSIIEIAATAIITRRFRIIYSAVIAFGSTVGLDVSTSASIPVEAYILDTVNFSGGGTYLAGVDYLDNKALFINSIGINNSAEIANYYMLNNATATIIPAVDTPTKIAGTTTANAINQKFTHTDNRATYTGAITRFFRVTTTISISSTSANDQIGSYIAKNGSVLAESEMYVTTNNNNRAESVTIQTVVELQQNDYLEMWVENASDGSDVTITFMNVIITRL